jgi:hypothetical protein
MLRERFTIPETALFYWGGTPAKTSVLMGTNKKASPTDWKARISTAVRKSMPG